MTRKPSFLLCFSLIVSLGLLLPDTSLAVPKIKLKTFSTVGFNGKKLLCGQVKKGGAFIAGVMKRKVFTSSLTLAKLSLIQARTPKQKKNARAQILLARNNNAICKQGPIVPTPTPTATVVASRDSLLPYSGPIDATLMQRFFLKAGFGQGAVEQPLANAAIQNQSLAPAVDAFTSLKQDDPAMLARVQDRLDERVGTPNVRSSLTPLGAQEAELDFAINTSNAFQERLLQCYFGLYTVGTSVLNGNQEQYFWNDYRNLLWSYTQNPDIPSLIKDAGETPMMLRWLNGDQNLKDAPNENYGREVMQLYSLGINSPDGSIAPNYTEADATGNEPNGDVHLMALAMTGWRIAVLPDAQGTPTARGVFSAQDHAGPVTLFQGKPWQATVSDDRSAITALASHPSFAPYLAKRMLGCFLGDTAAQNLNLINNLAAAIRATNYNLSQPLNMLLKSQAFLDPSYDQTRSVDPFEQAVTIVRTLGLQNAVNIPNLMSNINSSGFSFENPPTVFFYQRSQFTGSTYLSTTTSFIANILSDSGTLNAGGWKFSQIAPAGTANSSQTVDYLVNLLGIYGFDADSKAQLAFYLDNNKNSNGTFTKATYTNTVAQQNAKLRGAVVAILSDPTARAR